MKRKISTYVLCLMATVGCAGYAFSQPTKIIRLPSGIEVYDLSGEWDALIEIYGKAAAYGAYPNVVKITITGSFCPITG
jgi:hypothetical protein